MYILNLPRSDVITAADKSSKLNGLVDAVKRSAEVPQEDKEKIDNFVESDDGVGGRSLTDELTRANIWDCLVTIFNGGMDAYLNSQMAY